jgi:hypothetical protein
MKGKLVSQDNEHQQAIWISRKAGALMETQP